MNQEVNVTIRMNDDDVAKVVSRGLAALSDEDCASVVHDALKLIFSSKEGKQLFIKTDGYYGSRTQPTKFTEDLLKRCMESDAGFNSELKKCGEDFIHTLRDKQAFQACIEAAIKSMLFDSFSKQLFETTVDKVMHLQE